MDQEVKIVPVADWDGEQINCVIHGRMEDVLAKLKRKINVTVTSPPYSVGKIPQKKGTPKRNVKTKNQKYDFVVDEFDEGQYESWLKSLVDASGLVFWNVPAKQQKPFGTEAVKPFGHLIWTKGRGTIPFATKGVIYAHEYIFLCGDSAQLRPIFSFINEPAQRYSKHPAPFPPKIVAKCIHHSTAPGDLVFDPFGGSGTTAAVAKVMGRNWLTCDVSREYCGWIAERIEQTRVPKTVKQQGDT